MTRGRLALNSQKGHLNDDVQKDRLYKKRSHLLKKLTSVPSEENDELPVVVSVRCQTPPPTPTTMRTFTIESCLDAACAGEALSQLADQQRLNGSAPSLATTPGEEAGRSLDYTNPAYEPDGAKQGDLDQTKRSWSLVLRQVIDQQDDDDLHPYGRGGIYHNIIYGRNVKVKHDYNKIFLWLMLIGCLVLISGAIIFASELSLHYRNDERTSTASADMTAANATNLAKP